MRRRRIDLFRPLAGMVSLALAAVGVLGTTSVAVGAAEASESSPQMVYWPLVTDGAEYRRVSYPIEAGDLRVLADTQVVLEVREGLVSFWPITREHLVDYGTAIVDKNDFISGEFEIVDASGSTTVLDTMEFIEWYPDGVTQLGTEIVTGDDAVRRHDRYIQESAAAVERSQEYNRLIGEQQRIAELWLEAAAEDPDNPPPPPEFEEIQPPEPYRSYATEPREATVASFPEGKYTVRMRGEDGAIVEGTERRLVSFGPVSRGSGYVLIPEDRWTQPVPNHDPNEVIYTTMDDEDLFLLSVRAEQYNADVFARIFRPQLLDAPDSSATVWVPRPDEDKPPVSLNAWSLAGTSEMIPEAAYRVTQNTGANRGYTIEEVAPGAGETPDFTAMRLSAPDELDFVSLRDANGNEVPGSQRTVREFLLANDALLFVIAAMPFAVALAFGIGWRRRA